MLTPLLFSALLSGTAAAGDLQITTAVPVVVFVDSKAETYRPGSLTVIVRGLGDGDHEVVVRNLLGKQVASMTVAIDADEEVRLTYRKKTITELGRGQARPGAAEEDAAAQEAAAAERAARAEARAAAASQAMAGLSSMVENTAQQVEAMMADDEEEPPSVAESLPPLADPEAPAAPVEATSDAPGSLSVSEVGPLTGAVWVDGRSLKYGAGNDAFVSLNLSPGEHTVRIEDNGRVYHDGPMTIRAGQNTRCVLVYEGLTWVPDCHFTSPALTVVNQTLASFSAGSSTSAPAAAPAPKGMPAEAFAALLAAVEDESFSSDQIAMIRTAGAKNTFTVAQVGQLMDPLFSDSDKVDVVKLLADRIDDPENAALLAGHVDFSTDKEAILAIFE